MTVGDSESFDRRSDDRDRDEPGPSERPPASSPVTLDAWRPDPTGEPAADAVLEGLLGADGLPPAEEIAVYRSALDALGRLLEDQPQHPGAS